MTLYHGDCLDILPMLSAQSVDAVICDPPYGTTACKWDSVIPFEPMWRELKRIIKPRGAVVLFGSQPFTSALVMSNPKWFRYEWVWSKGQKSGHLNALFQPMSEHENILVFAEGRGIYNPQPNGVYKPRLGKGGQRPATHSVLYGQQKRNTVAIGDQPRFPSSILPIDKGRNNFVHPTQKPVALMEYLIRTYTNEGDTVLDFTMGSGTTGVACVNTGRDFIGIEQDAGYFETAQRRIAEAQAALVQMGIEEAA